MMSRLTHYQKDGEVAEPYNRIEAYDFTKKLAEYEDLEEQGLLVRLPCKVGDTVWKLEGFYCDICEKHHWRNPIKSKFSICDLDEIGKTVFPTREEAEAALKDMEEI